MCIRDRATVKIADCAEHIVSRFPSLCRWKRNHHGDHRGLKHTRCQRPQPQPQLELISRSQSIGRSQYKLDSQASAPLTLVKMHSLARRACISVLSKIKPLINPSLNAGRTDKSGPVHEAKGDTAFGPRKRRPPAAINDPSVPS